jgi:preprotein translocase subunit SecA
MTLLGKALEAEWLYRRDREYCVVEGQIKLVDRSSGRFVEGERYADERLHRASEVKEGVATSW